jgi:UDP-N-acetylmuramoyl-L-alanyl-D-glutamate--2,6-diaminopimelate ligase
VHTSSNQPPDVQLVPGRYEIIDEGQKFQVLVDAANTPGSLNTLLDSIRECGDAKRIILVFGCPGDEGTRQRAYMGEVAHYKADIVIITNDNPRTEPPEAIVQSIVDGFPDEVKHAYPGSYFNFLVDVGRVQPVRPS